MHTATSFPPDRANRYLVRITKGLTRHLYPNIDYEDAKFEITQITMDQEMADDVGQRFNYLGLGEGVFRAWYGLAQEGSGYIGMWLFVFYDAQAFLVEVSDLTGKL